MQGGEHFPTLCTTLVIDVSDCSLTVEGNIKE